VPRRPHPLVGVRLRVDREHAGRADHDVIDVGTAGPHRNRVDDVPAGPKTLELLRDHDLAEGAEVPAARVLRQRARAEEPPDRTGRRHLTLQLQALLDGRIARATRGKRELYTPTWIRDSHLSPTVRVGTGVRGAAAPEWVCPQRVCPQRVIRGTAGSASPAARSDMPLATTDGTLGTSGAHASTLDCWSLQRPIANSEDLS